MSIARAGSALSLLVTVFVTVLAPPAAAQQNFVAWHEDGQTWLKWTNNQTFAGAESWSIYRSSAPITSLASAQLISHYYPQDARGSGLNVVDPNATWRVPDPNSSGVLALTQNEALFVYTPHSAASEYFAVVKTGHSLVGPTNTFGPVAQTLDPVRPHVQLTGVNAGHPYTLYSLWIDGDADLASGRSDFPVMGGASFHGVPRLFCVFEPTVGLPPAPMPMVAFLHGGDGNFWTYRPSQSFAHQINAHIEDGLYVTFDDRVFIRSAPPLPPEPYSFRTRWFGFVGSFDRFQPPSNTPSPSELVTDTTPRQIDWVFDWLVANRGVDPQRIALAGLSMGARGTSTYVRTRPERVSATMMYVPPTGASFQFGFDGLFGGPGQNLMTSVGVGYEDLMLLHTPASTLDMPFGRIVSGTGDDVVMWVGAPNAYRELDASARGWHLYWDERGHTNNGNGWIGARFNGSPLLNLPELTRYRRDRSYPAFGSVDHSLAQAGQQPDPGDDVFPATGAPWGTWGGWLEWDDASLVDTQEHWGVNLALRTTSSFANDNAPTAAARARVVVRRAQQLAAQSGDRFVWTLRELASGALLASGTVVVGPDGELSTPRLELRAGARRLEFQRIRASADLEQL